MVPLFRAVMLVLVCAVPAFAQEQSVLRIAVLKFGTVSWEIETLRANGLDAEQGFALETLELAGSAAGKIAFQGGAADAMVADWIWVARQRAAGKDYVFVPYSKSVGGIAVPEDAGIATLEDLRGKTIGIAGGPLDKSWLILRAFGKQDYGFDLKDETKQVFGAPPLITQKTMDGEIDAAINYWHFLARMKAQGYVVIAPVNEAADALGLDPDMPILGYVFKGAFVRENPKLMAGFVAASRGAKEILAGDDAAWDAVRPMMRAKSDAEFEQLKAGFRAGIPEAGPVDPASAKALLRLMAELGGEALVGQASDLPDGVFYHPDE